MSSQSGETATLERARELLREIVEQADLLDTRLSVLARPLTPTEAIGIPGRRDFPIIIGRERVIEAIVEESRGQAFTDMYGNYSGRLVDIAAMDLKNNFRRAIFISSLNAVMRHLGLIAETVHCKNEQPRECSHKLAKYIEENYGQRRVARDRHLIGCNGAFFDGHSEYIPRKEMNPLMWRPKRISTD